MKQFNCRKQNKSRQGAALIFILLLMAVFVIIAAFAINAAHVQLVRTELKIATDSVARATGRQFITTGDKAFATDFAINNAGRNKVSGRPYRVDGSDVVFGEAIRSGLDNRYDFSSGGDTQKAVLISGRIGSGAAVRALS